jgi:hypothetical protein
MPKGKPEYSNPLQEFYEISGMTYAEIARMCQVPRQTIKDICGMDAEGLKNMRIRNVMQIKKYLNIDLFKYLEKVYKFNRKV